MSDLTSNLKLSLINPSDYVDPTIFNDNFEMLDTLGTDYITDQGQSGSWFYRKFRSGMAECWANITFSPTTQDGPVQSGFKFPFMFSSAPVVNVTAGVEGRNDAYVRYVSSTIDSVDCYIHKGTKDNLKRWLYCHAIGKVN